MIYIIRNLVEPSEYYFEIKPKNRLGLNLKELVEYKELFYFFTWRDIKVKYKQTILGFLWAILQPLLMMGIFTLFFGRALNVPSDEIPYPIFAMTGLVLWTVFSSGTVNAGNSMIANATIIKKIYFPRLVIPVTSILVSVFDFFMGLLPLIGLLIFYQQQLDLLTTSLYWILGLFLTIVATFGPGCWLASLNVKYRDFRYVIPFLVQVLLFVTPILYPISIIQEHWMRVLLSFNPMYAPIMLFRYPITGIIGDPQLILFSVLSSCVLLVCGLLYFRRTESYFADIA